MEVLCTFETISLTQSTRIEECLSFSTSFFVQANSALMSAATRLRTTAYDGWLFFLTDDCIHLIRAYATTFIKIRRWRAHQNTNAS